MVQHEIKCFYGEMETHYDLENTVAVKTDKEDAQFAVITKQNHINITSDKANVNPVDEADIQLDSQLNTQIASTASDKMSSKVAEFLRSSSKAKRGNMLLELKASEQTDAVIDWINNNNLGWTADTCRYTKDNKNHCSKDASSSDAPADETNVLLEVELESRGTKKFDEKSADFKKTLDKAQAFMKKYKTPQEIPVSELP